MSSEEPVSAEPGPKETAETSKKKRKKSRAWIYAALASTGLIALLGLFAWVRGSSADTVERDPEQASDGVLCQLFDAGDGRVPARCATIIEAPVEEVSAAVRDYERFGETFDSSLGTIELTSIEHVDDTTVHLVGRVTTVLLGEWPIDVSVRHDDLEDGTRTASWEETEGSEVFNRGRWVVSPVPGGSLVVYELEVQTEWAPTFLVNDVLLTQLPYPLRRVAERVGEAG